MTLTGGTLADIERQEGMRRYLLVALWPAGVAVIGAATVRAACRASRGSAGRTVGGVRAARLDPVPLALIDGAGGLGPKLVRAAGGGARARRETLVTRSAGRGGLVSDLIRLGIISCADAALSYGVMRLLGPTVVNHGPKIDEPIVRWTASHQVKRWAFVQERLGKVGNTWTTWGAAGTAAACLAVGWRTHKWLPPAALGAALLVDHYVTLAIRHKFRRPGPPGSPRGTYPSGGCDRVVLFYGLIAYMLWREFSGSATGKVWAFGTVTALAFNEACSRQYLSKHWFTDIVTGLLYGAILLGPFIAGVRMIAGPPRVLAEQGKLALAAAKMP
ncbi:MAG TPA: phosphatase PAP2 family protein [Streptosporangiaceae bacterium]|jgi:membrane-associated phospholipid phosphatase